MNITEQYLNAPGASVTDVRKTSQGDEYPLTTIVRRELDPMAGTYTGPLTHEGMHYGTGVRTGLIRSDRADAIADIRRVS